jgi:hypothetical protein
VPTAKNKPRTPYLKHKVAIIQEKKTEINIPAIKAKNGEPIFCNVNIPTE